MQWLYVMINDFYLKIRNKTKQYSPNPLSSHFSEIKKGKKQNSKEKI